MSEHNPGSSDPQGRKGPSAGISGQLGELAIWETSEQNGDLV